MIMKRVQIQTSLGCNIGSNPSPPAVVDGCDESESQHKGSVLHMTFDNHCAHVCMWFFIFKGFARSCYKSSVSDHPAVSETCMQSGINVC